MERTDLRVQKRVPLTLSVIVLIDMVMCEVQVSVRMRQRVESREEIFVAMREPNSEDSDRIGCVRRATIRCLSCLPALV
jgi:hypothetical protein